MHQGVRLEPEKVTKSLFFDKLAHVKYNNLCIKERIRLVKREVKLG